jgi:N-acetyl sugar amidotransferase
MSLRTCARCLYTEAHPLHLVLDAQFVCSGCRVHEEKDSIDWSERWRRLEALVGAFRTRVSGHYDCIVPVSGARDSHFTVHVVKHRLGLNPLLVSYNRHYNTDLGIRNLANLRMAFDADLLENTVQPQSAKAVTRAALQAIGSMHWHTLAGQTAWPVQVAVRMGIPLIVWGVHQGVDQVGMYSHFDEIEMSRRYRKEHDLMGWEIDDLVAADPGLDAHNLSPWRYPDAADIARVGIRGIYLSNYLRWDTKAQHESMIEAYGYETRAPSRTFDSYNDVDCHHYTGIHDVIRFRKHGYTKAVDQACREIRLRRMTRETGAALVAEHMNRPAPDGALLAEWLGMDVPGILGCADAHRNPAAYSGSAPIQPQHPPKALVEAARLPSVESDCSFRITPTRAPGQRDDAYVLIGKGWFDPEDTQ